MLPILTAWRVYRPNPPHLYNARMPLVSVLLPVHNASAALGAALDSLLAGPLHNRERVIICGAGQMARCLAKHLQRAGAQVAAFLKVNPQKYRTQLRGAPVLPATILPELHAANPQQLILVAVAAAGPRAIIRSRLAGWNLRETIDFWCVA